MKIHGLAFITLLANFMSVQTLFSLLDKKFV